VSDCGAYTYFGYGEPVNRPESNLSGLAQYRELLSIPTEYFMEPKGSMTVGSHVVKATLRLRSWEPAGKGVPIDLYAMTKPWSAPTWNFAQAGIKWTNPGGDYDASTAAAINPETQEFNLTKLTQEWVTGAGGGEQSVPAGGRVDYGAVLLDPEPAVAKGLYTEQNIDTEYFPVLVVEYEPEQIPPTLALTGGAVKAVEESAATGSYELHIGATDGSSVSPQSGVVKAVVSVNGYVAQTFTQSCPKGNCALEKSWTYSPASYASTPRTITVEVTDAAGNVTKQTLTPSIGKMTSPGEGTRSAGRFKLQAAWTAAGVTGVTFQEKEAGSGSWVNIPESAVTDKYGKAVKWPFATEGAHQNEPVYVNLETEAVGSLPPIANRDFRAVLAGTTEGYTSSVEVQINRDIGGPSDAQAEVGPGKVDLLTGNLDVGRTDVEISGFGPAMEFERNFDSRAANQEPTGVFGPGWSPGISVEEANETEWKSVAIESVAEVGATHEYAVLTALTGEQFSFEKVGSAFVAPPELEGWSLVQQTATHLVLTEPLGIVTSFERLGGGPEFLPTEISSPGQDALRLVYELKGAKERLKMLIGPSPSGITCTEARATETLGCRTLVFRYEPATKWGGTTSMGERLAGITYYAASTSRAMGHSEVAAYAYNSEGRLSEEWDPRVSPALRETYSYAAGGQLVEIKPAGEKPWIMDYGKVFTNEPADGRLLDVRRASLLTSPAQAQWTIKYQVPPSGEHAPYEMSAASVARWGQVDIPTDATAIFEPEHVPSGGTVNYTGATVDYMDVGGRLVNQATCGSSGGPSSISTTETDEFGNVVRTLTGQNRLAVLAAKTEAERTELSRQLDTESVYSENGIELLEVRGPRHRIRLESGETASGRLYSNFEYDAGKPGTVVVDPHLVTKETKAALVGGELKERRVTETKYDWTLLKPIESIVDPAGLNLRTVTSYDAAAQPIEERRPKDAATGSRAATTVITYYSAQEGAPNGCKVSAFAGLPCKVGPAAQPSGSLPELPVKQFETYDSLGQVTKMTEGPQKITTSYDSAGRQIKRTVEGVGTAVPPVETTYSSATGEPTGQRFVCEASCSGFDSQATVATYDELGRVNRYEDADGGVTTTKYDVAGRPIEVSDPKGLETLTYDPSSNLPVKIEDSGVGIFKAEYDADGHLVAKSFPDGLVAHAAYNAAGEVTTLSYEKGSACGGSCTWYAESVERSAFGQVLANSNSLGTDKYGYDKRGRLTLVDETPAGGSCLSRQFSYDADSNRTAVTSRASTFATCIESGGSTQSYTYDEADRLSGTGVAYDALGRTTALPAAYAGGEPLTTAYFADGMVAAQTQKGVTNSYGLDASLRPRDRRQAGGVAGDEVFHYDGSEDAPSWTANGSSWTRELAAFGGLVAIQQSSGGVKLQLTNIHGDVIAVASPSAAVEHLLGTSRFGAFGEPQAGSPGRYGWLGGDQIPTELPSGVMQMGARSYAAAAGRFLAADPVSNASVGPYVYANDDPLNATDETGERVSACYQLKMPKIDEDVVEGVITLVAIGYVHCTRAARQVSAKTVFLDIEYRGITAKVEGESGTRIPCGNGGTVGFRCEPTASVNISAANTPCNTVGHGSAFVYVETAWTTSRGNPLSARFGDYIGFGAFRHCEEE
jgi:RHS repeat-associated protein